MSECSNVTSTTSNQKRTNVMSRHVIGSNASCVLDNESQLRVDESLIHVVPPCATTRRRRRPSTNSKTFLAASRPCRRPAVSDGRPIYLILAATDKEPPDSRALAFLKRTGRCAPPTAAASIGHIGLGAWPASKSERKRW